jgi:hypothetical protein
MARRGTGALAAAFLNTAPQPRLDVPPVGKVVEAVGGPGALLLDLPDQPVARVPERPLLRLPPGIYYDVNEASYHADCAIEPSLSAGFGKLMLENSPDRARASHPRLNPGAPHFAPTAAMDEGSVLHRLLTGSGPEIAVVQADSWRTKDAKAERDVARMMGRVPILAHRMEALEGIAEVARGLLLDDPENRQALSDEYASEVTCIARMPTGAMCRIRPDRLHKTDESAPVYDFKFSQKLDHPTEWDRTIANSAWDMRAAFYGRVLSELRDGSEPPYRYVVFQTEPPVDMMIFELTDSFLKQGHMKAGLVINAWERCIAADHWPQYPRRTFYVEEPGWAERKLRDMTLFFEQMIPRAKSLPPDPGTLRDFALKQPAADLPSPLE